MTALTVLVLAMGLADVESGPKKDAAESALKVQFVTGTHEGKEVDFPAERKGEVTVYLFVSSDKFARPVGRFIKELDNKLAETNDKAVAAAVWFGGDAEKTKDYIPKVQGAFKTTKTDFGYLTTATPEGWGLNTDAHLTVVVTKDKKVVKTLAFVSVNDADVPKVLAAIKK
ncbi:hypothetical protein BH11PLA2_BH11PLA2_07900 [soil metagenome]